MKKAIMLLSAFFIMIYAEHDAQETLPVCMSWKDAIMMHWNSLSKIHQMLLVGLVGLATFWIVWRIIKCGKGGCGCYCGDSCSCKL